MATPTSHGHRSPLCTMVQNAGQWWTTQVGGAQYSPIPLRWCTTCVHALVHHLWTKSVRYCACEPSKKIKMLGQSLLLMDIGLPCAPWCTRQVSGTQCKSVVHNVVLYHWGSAQCRSHNPPQHTHTDGTVYYHNHWQRRMAQLIILCHFWWTKFLKYV